MDAASVLSRQRLWSVEQGDCLAWLPATPDDSVDLVVTSPPYTDARLYLENGEDLAIARNAEEWAAWMLGVCLELRRVCKGLCALVVEGRTEDYRYDASPLLLAADLHRAGFKLRKPAAYYRYGIPGSGGPDWWRNDWEPVICFARGKLPWSDATACGHAPKWGPGGEMSHRMGDGARVNQWGGGPASGATRRKSGDRQPAGRPSHRKTITRPRPGQSSQESTSYDPPAVANPGNVVRETYDAEQVRQLLAQFATREIEYGDVIRCLVGGGQTGHPLCHDNEAPFPETLAERFILSFCPLGGVVCDPFAGSGTTGAVALRHGRRFVGCDLRPSQVDLARKRIATETPSLFGGEV